MTASKLFTTKQQTLRCLKKDVFTLNFWCRPTLDFLGRYGDHFLCCPVPIRLFENTEQ